MSNVFNKTLNSYPESTQLLPESLRGVDGMLDEMVRNGYEYGRQYIKTSVRSALNVDSNVTQSKDVEKQILEVSCDEDNEDNCAHIDYNCRSGTGLTIYG